MRAGAITVTFSIIIFLSVMVFLKPDISSNASVSHQSTYSSVDLQKATAASKNATPYYDLNWKDRMALEQSVWGFDLKDMLLFSALFGVFFGSLKMAASRAGK